MEKEMLCATSDNALVKKFSEALVKQGINEGAQYYYTDDDFHLPFFKIPKAYKKESPDDPDIHFVFVDVDSNPPLKKNTRCTAITCTNISQMPIRPPNLLFS